MADEERSPLREKLESTGSGIIKRLGELQKFWSTRRAVLQGTPLWDFERAKLARKLPQQIDTR